MESRQVGLLLTVVMLVLVFDCGNCNIQKIGKVLSMRSNAVTRVEDSESVLHRDSRSVHRSRRSLLSSVDLQSALNTHNRCRGLVGAADAEKMIWNEYLASMANDWANNCRWEHGQPPRDPSTLPYTDLGQNLYAIIGATSINVTAAILEWFNERPYFNYETLACQPGQQCGHYTQIVWASSREVGCAIANCSPLSMLNTTSLAAIFFVCNYGPAGNVVGQKPFQIGTGCSKCATGSWWCNNGLCDQSCRAIGDTCGCAPMCYNFASVDTTTCSCVCAPGWQGSDCSVECKDFDQLCNPQPGQYGYPPDYCSRSDYGPRIQKLCPKMCNLCKTSGNGNGNGNGNNDSTSTKPSLLSMLAVWLSWLLLFSFRSI